MMRLVWGLLARREIGASYADFFIIGAGSSGTTAHIHRTRITYGGGWK
jgi:hypothetical protein